MKALSELADDLLVILLERLDACSSKLVDELIPASWINELQVSWSIEGDLITFEPQFAFTALAPAAAEERVELLMVRLQTAIDEEVVQLLSTKN